jgi:superfamily II DNA or RNA helicase
MNELQLTIGDNNKLLFWGFTSKTEEVFSSKSFLENVYQNITNNRKCKVSKVKLELIGFNEKVPLVPVSMKLFYVQYGKKDFKYKMFNPNSIIINNYEDIEKVILYDNKSDYLVGGSILFLRKLLQFAYHLVVKQRFLPFVKDNQSCFVANLDIQEDYLVFQDLINNCPISIKKENKIDEQVLISNFLDFLVNNIIQKALNGKNIFFKEETETDKWLNGLLIADNFLSSDFEKNVRSWVLEQKVNHNFDYVMLFKLTEPDELEENGWNLNFYMQSKKDPSLMVNLKDLWNNTKQISIPNIKMNLFKDLGLAAKNSKLVEKALYTPNPYVIKLNTDDAYQFIVNDSFYLKDSGFVVQIPKFTSVKTNKFKAKIKFKGLDKLKIHGTGSIGKTLFDFNYTISLGDVELTEEEFYELSESKSDLVKVKNKWVELNTDDVKKAIKFFKDRKKLSLYDTFVLNTEENVVDIDDVILPVEFEKEFSGFFDFTKIKEIKVPQNLTATLRAYQKEGFSWMVLLKKMGFGGILADDMGLGKTIQTIAYILEMKLKNTLIVCPTSIIGNWLKEFEKFAPSLKVYVHHGSQRITIKKKEYEKKINKVLDEHDIIITSYATIRSDEKLFVNSEFDSIILDEAQNIKNPFTKQTITINKLKADIKFCLTGTPIENRLSEFWSIMNFVNPGFFSSWNSFKKKFAEPIELNNDEDKSNLLKKIITPFIMRRLKTDKKIIKDLPVKTEIKEYCNLTKEQASLYQAVVDDSLEKIKSAEENRRALIMATLIKLKQVCNHPTNFLKDSTILTNRSGKVARLRQLIDIVIANNEKCLIFTQYTEMGALLQKDLENFFNEPVCFLHGSLDRKKRENMIELFQSDSLNAPKIFILSLKAGGTGLNLTKANHVIHFDRWWNPAVENQATDRAYRIGQKKDVFIYKFITNGTVEERIDDMIEKKLNLSNQVLSKGETAITELNNDELKNLLSLRKNILED